MPFFIYVIYENMFTFVTFKFVFQGPNWMKPRNFKVYEKGSME